VTLIWAPGFEIQNSKPMNLELRTNHLPASVAKYGKKVGFEVKEKGAGHGKGAKTKKRWVRESGGRDFVHALHERALKVTGPCLPTKTFQG
jgi:hypothetical protein